MKLGWLFSADVLKKSNKRDLARSCGSKQANLAEFLTLLFESTGVGNKQEIEKSVETKKIISPQRVGRTRISFRVWQLFIFPVSTEV